MATYAFPDIAPERLDWHLEVNQQVFRSPLTGAQQVVELTGAAWVIAATFGSLKQAEAATLGAFIARLRGSVNTFTWHHRGHPTPRGVGTGTPLVAGASQTGASLTTDGWTPSQTGILLAGDFFAVNGELKRLVTDADSDGAGAATLTFEPPLRASPADDAAITVTQPTATFRLLDARQGGARQAGPLTSLSLAAREAI